MYKQQEKKRAQFATHSARRARKLVYSFIMLPIRPPVPHLLRSNSPPSQAETSAISAAILDAEGEAMNLLKCGSTSTDSTSSGGETVLSARNTQKLHLITQFVVEQKAILSAVRCLPVELLQKIFCHSHSPHRGHRYYIDEPSCRVLPLALSQVCQRWRNAALSTPALWSLLPQINFRRKTAMIGKYDLEFISELLERSHGMSIDVHITGDFERDFSHPTLDTLMRHSNRWRNLTIYTTSPSFLALRNIKGNLSSLERLTVRYFYDVDNFATISIFETAPKLYNVHIERGNRTFLLPMNQILHFSQESVHLKQLCRFLPSNSCLKTLELIGLEGRVTLPNITLPSLVSLRAEFEAWTPAQMFFNSLTLPVLETLNISSPTDDLLVVITSLIKRSKISPVLTALFLECQTLYPGGLTALLKLTPVLKDLSITFPPPHDILALSSKQGDLALVPLLSRCHFSADSRLEISEDDLQALKVLAESRCESREHIHRADSRQTSLQSEQRPWQTFTISFSALPKKYYHQLEGWINSDHDMFKKLEMLGKRLWDLLPQIPSYCRPSLQQTWSFKWSGKDKAISTLNEIKALKVEKASDLLGSEIYDIIQRLSSFFEEREGGYILSQIAKEILRNWEPVLKDSVKDVHWLLSGWNLVYLPRNSEIRSSESAVDIFYNAEKWPVFRRPMQMMQ
ncbi:hypothetical protein GALMADRAFT_244242 [Galerina marginata CBS 339.88]|uniref:Uncharacterized protein n=1 Tax=Galerina marginata (strain CBS 339.88) TaxID=685588 RepID=A0A067TFM9_GALM3|nr:hypothetical protein GALMADRAFT_244242 [Galerina marginata CBS 339.88]